MSEAQNLEDLSALDAPEVNHPSALITDFLMGTGDIESALCSLAGSDSPVAKQLIARLSKIEEAIEGDDPIGETRRLLLRGGLSSPQDDRDREALKLLDDLNRAFREALGERSGLTLIDAEQINSLEVSPDFQNIKARAQHHEKQLKSLRGLFSGVKKKLERGETYSGVLNEPHTRATRSHAALQALSSLAEKLRDIAREQSTDEMDFPFSEAELRAAFEAEAKVEGVAQGNYDAAKNVFFRRLQNSLNECRSNAERKAVLIAATEALAEEVLALEVLGNDHMTCIKRDHTAIQIAEAESDEEVEVLDRPEGAGVFVVDASRLETVELLDDGDDNAAAWGNLLENDHDDEEGGSLPTMEVQGGARIRRRFAEKAGGEAEERKTMSTKEIVAAKLAVLKLSLERAQKESEATPVATFNARLNSYKLHARRFLEQATEAQQEIDRSLSKERNEDKKTALAKNSAQAAKMLAEINTLVTRLDAIRERKEREAVPEDINALRAIAEESSARRGTDERLAAAAKASPAPKPRAATRRNFWSYARNTLFAAGAAAVAYFGIFNPIQNYMSSTQGGDDNQIANIDPGTNPGEEAAKTIPANPEPEAERVPQTNVDTTGINTQTLWGQLYTQNEGDALATSTASNELVRINASHLLNQNGEPEVDQKLWESRIQGQLEAWQYERAGLGDTDAKTWEAYLATVNENDRDFVKAQVILDLNPSQGLDFIA